MLFLAAGKAAGDPFLSRESTRKFEERQHQHASVQDIANSDA
jgi:hypothetical protein